MIDLDHIDVQSANWAAERVKTKHPLPDKPFESMSRRESDAWFRDLHDVMNDWIGVIGALRRPGRVWVDVLLAANGWRGMSTEDCPTEAAISCAYWWKDTVLAAGVGLRASDEARTAHEDRIASGDLLALLGDEW